MNRIETVRLMAECQALWTGFHLLLSAIVMGVLLGAATGRAQSTPHLRVESRTTTQVGLCWDSAEGQVVLEESDTIDPGAYWRLVRVSPAPFNGSMCVSIDLNGVSRFFRLQRLDTNGLPSEPVATAPTLAPGVLTPLVEMSEFLYAGPNPIQTGVATNSIHPDRAAVLRGRVLQREGRPLPGVTISVLNQPSLGQTLSRADGQFDLVVNGGGLLVVNFAKPGFLSAQRQADVPWQDFATVPEVLMIPVDSIATTIALGASAPPQLHRGSPQTDADGTRQATVLIPPGISASLVMPDGSTQSVTSLKVRATEYTVGPDGPEAMPAELPPTSAYTYCVELSADEAIAAGAKDVRFGSPLPLYVENFLKFPVGTPVPLGSYDRSRGIWLPERSGKVIKVLGISAGAAVLDTDGNGVADDAGTMAALSITETERQQLAGLYGPGQSLWRVLIPHFTPWDLNWPYGLPDGAQGPEQDPRIEICLDGNCQQSGNSTIECENQILGEEVPVVGTPFALHYSSQRVPGRSAANTVEIPLTGAAVPAELAGVRLQIEIAGQVFRRSFPAETNQATTFTWNGRDAYGRVLHGQQRIMVRIGYTYRAVYTESPEFGETGANFILEADPVRQLITMWRVWEEQIGTRYSQPPGLGGWTISPHHTYFPNTHELWRGDGGRETMRATGPLISTYAGTGVTGHSGEGGPAIAARLHTPEGMAFGPDGSLYFASMAHMIRRIDPTGIITTVVSDGSGVFCDVPGCGDGGPAAKARLIGPRGIAVGRDNSLYIAETGAHRVRKVDPNGIITTIAGTGIAGFSGDGGPAHLAQFNTPQTIAVGPDDNVYVADSINGRVRRIRPDGIITTFAGGGNLAVGLGDGQPATQVRLFGLNGIAVGRDGSLYLAETGGSRVRRVTPDGIARTVAGNGQSGYSGDGFPATQARLSSPTALAVGPDDTIYVLDQGNRRVRWFRPGGPINTLAGTGVETTLGDLGPARAAALQNLDNGIAVGPDGAIYVAQAFGNVRIRRIAPLVDRFIAGELVPSADGSEVYVFTPEGRHLRTLDSLTGVVMYQFGYDGANRLTSITDRETNITRVEWSVQGRPVAIVGPYGQSTGLELDTNGWLARIENPAGETVRLTHDHLGLLKQVTRPGGQASRYEYDLVGRLTSANDPTGAIKHLDRMGSNDNYTVTMTTHLGRTTTYRVRHFPNGDTLRVTTDCGGGTALVLIGSDGRVTATDGEGLTHFLGLSPDPRWGMRVPLEANLTTIRTGHFTNVSTLQRQVSLFQATDPLSVRTLTEIVTANGRSWTNSYTASNRTMVVTSPTGRRGSVSFDAQARPEQFLTPEREPLAFRYDDRGRIASAERGQGMSRRLDSLAYDANGFLASITDAIGRTTSFTNDAVGRVMHQRLPGDRVFRFRYDTNGNVRGVVPPGRLEHTFSYTGRDEFTAYVPPPVETVSAETRYFYDVDRKPIRIERPDGRVVRLEYEGPGCQLSSLDVGNRQVTYAYNSAGQLASLNASDGVTLEYAYDGEVPTNFVWAGVVAGSLSALYDNEQRPVTLWVNGTARIDLRYDADGLPVQVGQLVLTRSTENTMVTGTTVGAITETLQHDAFGAVRNYSAAHTGSVVYAENYTRDALGRITRKTETRAGATRVWDYTYDAAGRLAQVARDGVVTGTYAYDLNGNRVSRTDAGATVATICDEQDRLLQQGFILYQYNADGQRINKADGGQLTASQYDGVGRMTGAVLPDGTRIDYVLDPVGRRVGRKVNGALVQGFLYLDALRPVAELNSAGELVSLFVYGSGQSTPDYLVKAGVTYRILTDHLGSPRAVVNAATGEVVQEMDHDEFGRVIRDTHPGFQPFGFAGGLYDRQTGLVQFGAREYDPETGRWTTKDPIGFAGGDGNLYAYVGNDPVNHIDPTGLVWIDSCRAALPLCAAAMEGGRRVYQAAGQVYPRVGQAIRGTVQTVFRTISRLCSRSPSAQPTSAPPQVAQNASQTLRYAGAPPAPRPIPGVRVRGQDLEAWLIRAGEIGPNAKDFGSHARMAMREWNNVFHTVLTQLRVGGAQGMEAFDRANRITAEIMGYDPARWLP